MKSKYALVSGIIFGLLAVLQILRALDQWPVQAGPFAIPVWFSWLAGVVAGGLCIWAFTSRRQ